MEIKKFWDNGVSYQDYLSNAAERLEHPQTDEDKDYEEYYKLGIQRMNRMNEKFHPNEQQLERLAQKKFDGKILIISEAWCGDASQVVPVVSNFFGTEKVKISYRDQDPSLIDDFLTNGSKSIPVVIILDKDFNYINHWGPRPKHGKELLEMHKADPEGFSKEDFYVKLQTYYAKNRGLDTIEELLELIPNQ
ncbi:thioredoxin family protein [Chryseobacterium sp. POL2]|uniref:thioredoxin family protein n=1 Tax=Chryseobacterium sp. POL2 TaxID=2713414 RepID=UPI0013E14DEB|nr:thioredoxin family protein [Chryseobacterium sp. POL2]QIG89791.1 thioredoxin family protein [Chryseobacterium sp. POL2]